MSRQSVKRKSALLEHVHDINASSCLEILQDTKESGSRYICLYCRRCSETIAQLVQQHVSASISGHELFLDTHLTALFCTACTDYVYNADFFQLTKVLHPTASADFGGFPPVDDIQLLTVCMKPKSIEAEEVPTLIYNDCILDGKQLCPKATCEPVADDGFPAGLRGLNNMGNTCFMNSVLQGLIHAPLLRNYFLLGYHTKQSCSVVADGGFCVSCELDDLFNEAYSGIRIAYSPAQFLYTWWMLAGSHLGSYQQHDAHEFFLFVLEMLNATAEAGNISSRVFGGTLRSDVICSSCGHASTTQDPFTHLSLDVPPREQLIPLPILPRPSTNLVGSKNAACNRAVPKLGVIPAKAARRCSEEGEGDPECGGPEAATQESAPMPSSSLDLCASSEVEASEEVAGSTLRGPRQPHLRKPAVPVKSEGEVQLEGSPSLLESEGGIQQSGKLQTAARALVSSKQDLLSQQEAASAVGGFGGMAYDSEDAQDTLSSPKMSQAGGPGPPRRGRGRPPIPRGRGGRRSGGRGRGRRKLGSEEIWAGALAAASSGGSLGHNDTALTADAMGASTNLPGSEPGAAEGRSQAAMFPQLAGYQRWPAASLLGCLHRFVRREELGSAAMECARCGSKQAHKQLSLRSLPPVLVLHAKRFEHRGGLRATARKLDTDLSFPLADLDMRPFMSAAVLCTRHGLDPDVLEAATQELPPARPSTNRSRKASAPHGSGAHPAAASPPQAQASPGIATEPGLAPSREDFLYDLHTVVCHRGNFQGGHYVAYVRGGDGRWYLCDDAWVVAVDEAVVRTVQAYMLFYVRKCLS